MGPWAHPGRRGYSVTETELEGWEYWTTPAFPAGSSGSARPSGALAAVVIAAPTLDDLVKRVIIYTSDLDAHVREARQKLDAIPGHWEGERKVQEALIDALARLSRTATLAT